MKWDCKDCAKSYRHDPEKIGYCDNFGDTPFEICFVPTDEAKGRADMEADAECDRRAGR